MEAPRRLHHRSRRPPGLHSNERASDIRMPRFLDGRPAEAPPICRVTAAKAAALWRSIELGALRVQGRSRSLQHTYAQHPRPGPGRFRTRAEATKRTKLEKLEHAAEALDISRQQARIQRSCCPGTAAVAAMPSFLHLDMAEETRMALGQVSRPCLLDIGPELRATAGRQSHPIFRPFRRDQRETRGPRMSTARLLNRSFSPCSAQDNYVTAAVDELSANAWYRWLDVLR